MSKYKCDLFKCPKGNGNICCISCEKFENCDEKCLNHPEKCRLAIKVSDSNKKSE